MEMTCWDILGLLPLVEAVTYMFQGLGVPDPTLPGRLPFSRAQLCQKQPGAARSSQEAARRSQGAAGKGRPDQGNASKGRGQGRADSQAMGGDKIYTMA